VGTLTVCIARVRPDEVSGAVRIELAPDQADSYLDTRYYPTLIHRFPFRVRLDDHAGYDTTAPDRPPDRPDGYPTARFLLLTPTLLRPQLSGLARVVQPRDAAEGRIGPSAT
jgi:hypothetical protein